MYEKEWLPHALAIGISYNDFWNMNPHIIKLIGIGYKNKIQTMDNLMWTWFGNYALSAVSVAVEHNLAGKKAKSKYIEKPVLEMLEEEEYKRKQDRKEYKGMTEEEKQKAEWEKAKAYFDSLIARNPRSDSGS